MDLFYNIKDGYMSVFYIFRALNLLKTVSAQPNVPNVEL